MSGIFLFFNLVFINGLEFYKYLMANIIISPINNMPTAIRTELKRDFFSTLIGIESSLKNEKTHD